MNKNEIMYKCPKCDRLISKVSYMTISDAHLCPMCGTSIIYFEPFKIDKSDDIYPPIDIEDVIKCLIEEIFEEEISKKEFVKIYLDGYSRGFEEGADEGYAEGYDEGYDESQNDSYNVI